MKIALLSTLIEESKFNELTTLNKAGNPSGQNFYLRLFSCLESFAEVTAFSLVPNEVVEAKDSRFHYFHHSKGRLSMLNDAKMIARTILDANKVNHFDIILYNSLSLTLAKAASIIVKKANLKVICIATDDPSNISFAPFYYPILCRHYNNNADGYICLTDGLDRLFNKKRKTSLIQMGIVEKPIETSSPVEKPYMYFGGALFEKDGVGDLIRAYLEVKPALDLYVAGHGPMKEELALKNEKGLHFLGQISKDEHLRYVQNAELVINPRRYNLLLDNVSVPSKVLEYIALSKTCLSSVSTPIKNIFGDNVNWLEGARPNESNIKQFFKDHIDDAGNLISVNKNKAHGMIQDKCGIEAVSKRLETYFNFLLDR